jgi:two-component system, OmpR family, sensor kinase
MAYPSRKRGLWRSARELPGRTPLRVKLTAAILVLVTAALAVISVAGIAFLRSYLLNEADQQLRAVALNARPSDIVQSYLFFGAGSAQPAYGGISIQWLPEKGHLQQVIAEYSGFRAGQPHQVPGPAINRSDSWLNTPQRANHRAYSWLNTSGAPVSAPVTVSASSGNGRWRVVSSPDSFHSPSPSSPLVKGTIIVGLDVTTQYRTLDELTIIDLIISGALLLVLTIVGIAVIRSSMRPLRDIEQTAEAIAAGNLGRRVPERDPRTEVGRLGRSLNTMLAHIETAFRARMASEEAARRSEEAARRSALDASRSEDRMRQFVADASHELRTPLTAIRGYAEYYRQRGGVGDAPQDAGHTPAAAGDIRADASNTPHAAGDTPDDEGDALPDTVSPSRSSGPGAGSSANGAGTRAPAGLPAGPLTHADLDRLIERVESEAMRMGVLVDDMLLLARLDQERPLDFKTVDLLAIAADALHDARVMAPQRTINLTVGTADAPLVTGDEVGLRQVVGNLVSNALTHTPKGTPIDITIRSGALGNGHQPTTGAAQTPAPGGQPPQGQDGDRAVILEVSDQGPGLTDEQKEHVFERFYRTDRARSRRAGGTGLGLAIVAAMVSAHHGRVWVESDPGSGATFGFALPLAPEARATRD